MQSKGNKQMEDVGNENFHELFLRSSFKCQALKMLLYNGKMLAMRISMTCFQHHHALSRAIGNVVIECMVSSMI